MDKLKISKMDFSTDFINENIGLYPLMGGTHYGSGANERFGGVIREQVEDGRYRLVAEKGSFEPEVEAYDAKKDPHRRMAVKRLIGNRFFSRYELSADILDRAGVGFDIKSEKTHLFVELTGDRYINAVLEERCFVFDARLPEGESPRRIEGVTLVLEINAPKITVSVTHKGKTQQVVSLHLDALCDTGECEVCLAAALECPAVCVINEVKWL